MEIMEAIGTQLKMAYTIPQFMGYRFACLIMQQKMLGALLILIISGSQKRFQHLKKL
jgi:hypothetical protein